MDGHADNAKVDHSKMEGMDGMDGMDMGGMQMFFTTGVDVTIMFENWHVTNVGGLIGSCIGIFLLAIIYEGIKYFREYLFRRINPEAHYTTANSDNGRMIQPETARVRYRMINSHHFLQTFLHIVQVTVSYFLMLIFMTYNVWLCISVVLGAGVGFFVFGWRKAVVVDITEHCH